MSRQIQVKDDEKSKEAKKFVSHIETALYMVGQEIRFEHAGGGKFFKAIRVEGQDRNRKTAVYCTLSFLMADDKDCIESVELCFAIGSPILSESDQEREGVSAGELLVCYGQTCLLLGKLTRGHPNWVATKTQVKDKEYYCIMGRYRSSITTNSEGKFTCMPSDIKAVVEKIIEVIEKLRTTAKEM